MFIRFDRGTCGGKSRFDRRPSDHQPGEGPGDGVQQALQIPGNNDLAEKGQLVGKRKSKYQK